MRTLVILAAGKSTRLDGAFKPNLLVGGQRMIDWQRQAAHADRTVLVAHEDTHFPEPGVHTVWTDRQDGPAQALGVGLKLVWKGEVLVTLADTWWSTTPEGSDWVGVCRAEGGRAWDYPEGDSYNRSHVSAHRVLDVCVGLYCFSDCEELVKAVGKAMDTRTSDREVSMAEVLHFYDRTLLNVQIPEWLDVGSTETWRHADATLRGAV